MKSRRIWLILGLVVIGLFWSFIYYNVSAIAEPVHESAAASTLQLVLNTAQKWPRSTPDGQGFEDLILKEAFTRLAIDVQIVHLPSERALINANQGIDDGNFVRVESMSKLYPNLIRVPISFTDFEFVCFTKSVDLRVAGWESLRPYNVGIITGWKILEENVVGVQSLTRVKDDSTLFSLLDHDRVDLAIYDRVEGLAMIKNMALTGVKPLDPPVAIRPMYLYLHKKHMDLVPRLTEVLAEMKINGTIREITEEVLKRLGP